jgi:N-acetylmuramoyl-L-alanine amidase
MRIRPQDIDSLTRTLWGEARSETLEGKVAVAHVVLNRLKRPGWWSRQRGDGIPDDSIEAVCRDPWQFSTWNSGDPNRAKLEAVDLGDGAFRDCMLAALLAVTGRAADPTRGSTHYHATRIRAPRWARGRSPAVVIGRHLFFNDID